MGYGSCVLAPVGADEAHFTVKTVRADDTSDPKVRLEELRKEYEAFTNK